LHHQLGCTLKQKLLLVLFSGVISWNSFSQNHFEINYPDLTEYEGVYEYIGNDALGMAASPKDLKLYAIIDDARYPLTPVGKDLFLNPGKQEVRFIRDPAKKIIGYTVKDDHPGHLYRLLNKEIVFPQTMWYPRMNASPYAYTIPKDFHDGLPTGSLTGTGLDSAALVQMVNHIAEGSLPNIHSVLIIKDGKLVFEEYFYEYEQNTLQQIRSATKSFISALIGIAINKGLIKSKDEPVISFFPGYKLDNLTEDKKKITIENMLNQQSGLDCNDHNGRSPGNEEKMYPTGDWVKFILDLPLAAKPGAEAMYCSGNVMVLAAIIVKVSGKSLYEFAKENLFEPLGVSGYKWNFRPDSSQMNTFGQLYIRPRDMAKFGWIYLNHGKWNNLEVVPDAWVKETLTPQTTLENTPYGYLWWHPWLMVNGIRNDATAAKGNGGQRIYLRPDLNMVVVITGGNYNAESSSDNLLAHYILPAFNRK
jgi:CubicO group peptidase (beta-lactamase class C family)